MRLQWIASTPVFFGLLLSCTLPVSGIEIATGSMLGPRYQQDHFYVRNHSGSPWTRTYEKGSFRRKVRGSLAMLRVTQALYNDDWLKERQFDPAANTDQLIEQLDLYMQHGIGGLVVSLQGSDPGYNSNVNGITRGPSADLGEKSGSLISAYNADGSLKPDWLARLDKLLNATNRRDLIVCLVLFQQQQDEALASPQMIMNAARNVARYLIARNARNVILDIADAWDEQEDHWDHRRFIPRNLVSLIGIVREQFQEADFVLPIGASSSSGRMYPIPLSQLCDVVLLHGDGRSINQKMASAQRFKQYKRPVLMVSDYNGLHSKVEELDQERAMAESYLLNASGWSYSPTMTANQFPFVYQPAASAQFTEDESTEKRHGAYFRAVLEQIAKIVLNRPPSTLPKGKR